MFQVFHVKYGRNLVILASKVGYLLFLRIYVAVVEAKVEACMHVCLLLKIELQLKRTKKRYRLETYEETL